MVSRFYRYAQTRPLRGVVLILFVALSVTIAWDIVRWDFAQAPGLGGQRQTSMLEMRRLRIGIAWGLSESPPDHEKLSIDASELSQLCAAIPSWIDPRGPEPHSRALPTMFTNIADINRRSQTCAAAALNLATSIERARPVGELRTKLQEMHTTCTACHDLYRKPKPPIVFVIDWWRGRE